MANKVTIKSGLQAALPKLSAGEFAFTTDTKKLYVGDGTNNVCINELVAGIAAGNLVVVGEDGKINAALLPEVEATWAEITGKPTTLAGYGITNGLSTDSIIDCGTF